MEYRVRVLGELHQSFSPYFLHDLDDRTKWNKADHVTSLKIALTSPLL